MAQKSFHSLSAAASPRLVIVRIPRLCLIWANTGSMLAALFLGWARIQACVWGTAADPASITERADGARVR